MGQKQAHDQTLLKLLEVKPAITMWDMLQMTGFFAEVKQDLWRVRGQKM